MYTAADGCIAWPWSSLFFAAILVVWLLLMWYQRGYTDNSYSRVYRDSCGRMIEEGYDATKNSNKTVGQTTPTKSRTPHTVVLLLYRDHTPKLKMRFYHLVRMR